MAEWSCSGLQSRLRRFDSDPSLISSVPRRAKKINGVAKNPENPANPAYRRLELSIDQMGQGGVHGRGGTYELVEFPAAFLLECLKTCIRGYRTHLLAKGSVPHAIYFHGFEDLLSTVHLLDPESLPEGGAVR